MGSALRALEAPLTAHQTQPAVDPSEPCDMIRCYPLSDPGAEEKTP